MSIRTACTLFALLAPAVGFAQSETDLDDFGGLSTKPTSTVADEANALREEATGAKIGPEEEARRRRRVIKTLQRKTFMKIGRLEIAGGVGFVSNDPFINRYIGHVDFTYHFTEVASLQVAGGFAPKFGDTFDYKPITKQIVGENNVTPDISRLQAYGNATLQFAPIYGKVAAPGNKIINFDIYGMFGTGIAQTVDDLVALDKVGDPIAEATEVEIHPTLNFGGGARIVFTNNIAVRVEGRGLSYIEVLESLNLEMKNNFVLQASFAYFLGKGG